MYKNGIDKKRKAGWADDFGDTTETDAEWFTWTDDQYPGLS